jgi:hypothetical protein
MKNLISTLIAAALILTGCSKVQDNNSLGKLVVKVTDDPFRIDYITSATVKITKIEARKTGVQDGNPFIVLSTDTLSFDLIKLRNGVTSELVNLDVPQGNYDLIRLYVDEAGLKIKDQSAEYKVKVPSGQQTGIKVFIKPLLRVDGGLTSELLLDFDLSKSFVLRGNLNHSAGINGFIFKPVIRAVNNTTAGRLEGMVTDTAKVKIKEASVWVKQDTIVANAIADTLGHYAIIGIPAGTYSVFAAKTNYDTVKVDGVKIVEGNRTMLNFVLPKK